MLIIRQSWPHEKLSATNSGRIGWVGALPRWLGTPFPARRMRTVAVVHGCRGFLNKGGPANVRTGDGLLTPASNATGQYVIDWF